MVELLVVLLLFEECWSTIMEKLPGVTEESGKSKVKSMLTIFLSWDEAIGGNN